MVEYALYLPQLRMSFGAIEERAAAAEELGFHSVWLMDHLAAPGLPDADTLEAWTVATTLAARTSRIHIGHLVLCDAFRHPALLAKMAATLDVASGGRLELGIGWGSVEPLVARHADWWNCPSYAVDDLDALRTQVGGARVSTQHPVALAPSRSGRDDVIAVARRRFGSWGGLLAGTADEVAAALVAEAAKGVELCILQFSDFAPPETLARFAADVAPAIRDAAPARR